MNSLPEIEPTKLSLRTSPFDNPDYLFVLKHDGFRSLAYILDDKCTLLWAEELATQGTTRSANENPG